MALHASTLQDTANGPVRTHRIAKAIEKADGAVKPYVKSVKGVTLRDAPVFKRILAIVQRVVPARLLSLLKIQPKGGEAIEGKAVPVQVSPKRQVVRSAPPPNHLSATPPKALPKPPGSAPKSTDAGVVVPPEIEKAGQDVINSVGDFFKNVGGSMDNLLVGEKKPAAPKQRGIIIA